MVRRSQLVLVLAAAAALGAGAATAATPKAAPTLRACADRHGALSLLHKGHCAAGTHLVRFPLTGRTGPAGPPGATGTVDASQYYTKAQSDGRFAPLSTVGTALLLDGEDFHPERSSAAWSLTTQHGVWSSTGDGFDAGLSQLPEGATVTSVTFYLLCTAGPCTDEVGVTADHPATGQNVTLIADGHLGGPGASAQAVDVSLTPATATSSSTTLTIAWQPLASTSSDQLLGALVHYTVSG